MKQKTFSMWLEVENHEICVTFKVDATQTELSHPDDFAPLYGDSYSSPEIDSVELLLFGQGVDITKAYKEARKAHKDAVDDMLLEYAINNEEN